jgi:hypothetical protein
VDARCDTRVGVENGLPGEVRVGRCGRGGTQMNDPFGWPIIA